MYICLCQALTERQVRQHIESGAQSLHDVQKKCAAGKSCGACVTKLKMLLKQKQADDK
ncbi:MAG: (2Fe-2S)-binding protein [Bdellovibrionota bacterium]